MDVVAAAIVRHGRVLAARRTSPTGAAGRWELPGGKVDAGETPQQAVVREVREELGCLVEVVSPLQGRAPLGADAELAAYVVRIVAGEPRPAEHDALRWLGPEDLDDVDWLPPDRPFVTQLEPLLGRGERLAGGHVGGAVRVGRSVRRTTGPWTPAVHALLAHLAESGLDATPRVLGVDSAGREALTYLPGRVPDVDVEEVAEPLLTAAMAWLRRFHDAVETFSHPGPWRSSATPAAEGQLLCHHDFAPYNAAVTTCPTGETVTGVFDWDMAGPGTRLEDLAFAAWNWVPLHRELPAERVARRLALMCRGYGGGPSALDVARAVVPRIERSVRVIAAGQAAGDPGMLNLAAIGEPQRTEELVDALRVRLPGILAALGGGVGS